jgi:hypothetical protein
MTHQRSNVLQTKCFFGLRLLSIEATANTTRRTSSYSPIRNFQRPLTLHSVGHQHAFLFPPLILITQRPVELSSTRRASLCERAHNSTPHHIATLSTLSIATRCCCKPTRVAPHLLFTVKHGATYKHHERSLMQARVPRCIHAAIFRRRRRRTTTHKQHKQQTRHTHTHTHTTPQPPIGRFSRGFNPSSARLVARQVGYDYSLLHTNRQA